MTKNYGSKWLPWYFGIDNTPTNLNHNSPYVNDVKINAENPGFYFGITDRMIKVGPPIETVDHLIERIRQRKSGETQA